MGYYKVPQDIEAEDTILGPLTLKQMIFIIVAGVLVFLGVVLSQASPLFAIPLAPPFLVFLVLGIYRPKDQPVENKLAAYLGFYLKPRVKVWSRDGIVDHVTITAPKTIPRHYADSRTPEQVRSQLKQLAQVVDTRGWSTHNKSVQLPTNQPDDDRIVAAPTRVEPIDDTQSDVDRNDIFDLENNPVAQKVTELTEASAEKTRQEAIEHMKHPDQDSAKPITNRQQTYPTQPQSPQPTQTVFQPQTKQTKDENGDLDPLKPLTPSESPSYNPYPLHMHQHVLNRDGTLTGLDTGIDTPSVAPPQTQTSKNLKEDQKTIDKKDKNELINLADAGLNVEALQRHGREMEEEHSSDGTSGEIVIKH